MKNLDSDSQALISSQRGGVCLDSKWDNGKSYGWLARS